MSSPGTYIDQDAPYFQDEKLEPIRTPTPEVAPVPTPKRDPKALKWDLYGLAVHQNDIDSDDPLVEPRSIGPQMTEPATDPDARETVAKTGANPPRPSPTVHGQTEDVGLEETAALAIQRSRSTERVDSKNNSEDVVPQLSPERRKELKVETKPRSSSSATFVAAEDSLANSPTVSRHMIHIDQRNATLPAVLSDGPARDGSANSPRRTSGPLPPYSELAQLASVAAQQAQQDPRNHPAGHQHKPSFSSTTSQSPRLPYHPSFPNSSQASPASYGTLSASTIRSPASTVGDASHYNTQFPSFTGQPGYYGDRRPSTATEGPQGLMPTIPKLRSGSSSESHGNASSSTDGISTAQTTPIDSSALVDGTARPILPPPPGMNVGGIFKCDFDGCSAQPFQTQYLLSSHKNVHSSSRPHYCPVSDCPRSEGGKGFKRKNEMIRHGLVHNSPGYICPFCPDRDHRYPRPDNLQRHVRVHHVDKDKDDPQLRAVLGQRPEGAIQKQRRRRTQSSATAPELPPA